MLHKLLNKSTNGFNGFLLKLTLQGLRRLNTHIVRQAKPITPEILRIIYQQLDHSKEEDVIFWVTCVSAFFLLFRKSNLLPDTKNGFDETKQLARNDVLIMKDSATVGIRWSKNHQFSRELLTFPLPRLRQSILCPVKALTNLKTLIPNPKSKHLFANSKGESLTYRTFQSRLTEVLKKGNIPEYHAFSGHSFR